MALRINQSGTYRCTKSLCVNQSGTYRETLTGCINQAGTYRLFGTFLSQPQTLGSSFSGGFLICKPGSSPAWVVSPYSAEVSRTWYVQGQAATRAQQVTGCTGWFTPDITTMQSPGYVCRSFWGPSPCYSLTNYITNTNARSNGGGHNGYILDFANGVTSTGGWKPSHFCARAFRCVTY